VNSIRGVLSFVKTASSGSFAAAGRELSISAVAVSKNVTRLERELGVRLLQRSTRKLALTAEGRRFFENCSGPLLALEGARSAVRAQARSISGTVRVTSITPFGMSYVLPLIPAFSLRYPDVEVEFHPDDRVSDMILQGYDVGFRVGRMQGATAVARRVAVLRFVVCGSPEYLARRLAPQHPTELASHNCLRLRHRSTGRILDWVLARDGEEIRPVVRGNFVSNDLLALIGAAAHGQGLVYAPLPRVLPLLRRGELKVVLPDWRSPGLDVFLHYPSRKGLPARVRAFIEFVTGELAKNPDLHTPPEIQLAPFR